MTDSMILHVRYPAGRDRITLRCEPDWEHDLEPETTSPDRTRFDFRIGFDAPFRYFKVVLQRDGRTHWSQGENYLALQNGHTRMDVYPRFFDGGGCSACELHRLTSPDGRREHAVRVFYPAGYVENPLESYPVVYMQDGQNLFFPGEAFGGHDWMIGETLGVLDSMNLVQRAIVVGVYPQDRMVDYTQDGYESYGRFLIDVVRPWVDAHYRTRSGPEHTAVIGSSLGGVVSLYLAWHWPEVFGYAGCLSSTFGYRDDLARRVLREAKRPIKVYLDSGWPRDNYEVTRNMRNRLIERGFVEGRDLMYLAFPNARHDERSWAMRAHIPLQHFFRV